MVSPACYVVLGTPRSGTSLAAGILHHLGVPMGERIADPADPDRWDFPGPDEWNPAGFFECAAVGNWCLAAVGWPWPDGDVVLTDPQRDGLRAVLRRRAAAAPEWGVKAAALAWVLDEFAAACPAPVRFVRCVRPPGRSGDSWAARAGCGRGEAGRIVAGVERQLDRHRGVWAGAAELDFDRLAEWPGLLAGFTGRPTTPAAAALPDPTLVRF